jgi:hypothetical protein
MYSSDVGGRVSELEEQVNALMREKRRLEERIRELERPRKYVANLKDLYWVEIQ